MYTSPEATIIFVTLFWTIVTVSSWIIRSALLWLLDTSFTQQPKQNMINSNAKSKLFVTSPSLNNFRNLIRDKFSSTPQLVIMLVDAIATIEICACSLELWPIREVFGYWGLMIAIMLNGIRSNLFISLDAFGSPCNPWYRFLLGRTQLIWMASTWVIQLLSASIALEICKFWWSLKITIYHSARYELALKMLDPKNLINYTPDLNVTVWIGFLCEAIGTFLDFYLVTLFSCALKYWNSRSIKYDSDTLTTTNVNGAIINSQVSYSCSLTRKQFLTSFILRTMISFILTAYGLGWTGMYLNPANAFIQCWRIGVFHQSVI
ncbi:unnamed protein product [Heterobilharzia americana]|nr:unnamed protein product [Heterobilharzia americana]